MGKISKKNKNLLDELTKIADEFGYWSQEVKDFNSTLEYSVSIKINNYYHALQSMRRDASIRR